MAPVCALACRLSLSALFVFVLFASVVVSVNSLLVYDRQTLLDLCPSLTGMVNFHVGFSKSQAPYSPSRIPAFLSRPQAPLPRRRRHRRRGKRGGQLAFAGSRRLLACSCRRFAGGSSPLSLLLSLPPEARGEFPPPGSAAALDAPAPVKFGLVNARSLTNKTFILKDLFISRGLDFLCVTETWLRTGEFAPLNELSSPECLYFNSPRSSGRKGGGLAVVFKNDFKCRQIRLQSSFSSFKLCMFELGLSDVVLCAVVYRPPKYHKDFLNDFSEFLAEILAQI
ncbi:uncharacterized protein [Nerophis lumbriciformis]|uniref:uncharacterized protein n=1 Tax=Nerophis lumbriciformis TaxID=546530 RepID=UPI002ADFB317|nr:uncharacterized protein LOC133622241 [Nerophis lumbriciformis]